MSSQMGPPPPKRTSLTHKRGSITARRSSSSMAPTPSENGGTSSHGGNTSKPSSPDAPSPVGGERTVKKLRLSKALTIPEGTTVSDACRRMAARRVNAALLTDANALLSGIVTDKDISARVIAEGLRPEQTIVSKIMTRNPIFVNSDSLAIEALQKMVQGKFRHLPVVENGEVIALLDITKCLYDAISRMEKAAEQGSAIAAAVEGVERQWGNNSTAPHAFIETLRERMFKPALSTIIGEQTKVAVASPSDPVYVAAKKMRELRVNSAIVVTGKKIQGILTSKDILMRVVAQNLSPELTLVEKVMTPNPECVTLETTVLDALHVMHDGKFLHLPVLDKDGSAAACVDVLQITHAAISMVESSSGAVNDAASTMMQKFWDSALALEPPDDYDTQSEMSALMASDGAELGRYPSLGLGNSFAFKFEDLKGRIHRLNCCTENLDELLSTVLQRIGAENEQDRPQLLYEDDDGDKVLLATDGDLIGALSHARSVGLKTVNANRMELEDVHSDICSLRKLYGLLQGSPDGVQMAGFLDERARVLLKNLLDAATEKALLAYSKIIVAAQLGVSNTPYSSQSVQPKTMPYLEPPVSPDAENASPSTIQSSNAKTNLCVNSAWKNEQSLIKPTPQDSGSEHSKFSVSLNKPEGRKKFCQVCKQSSMKQRNSDNNLNKDGNERYQHHDEASWINGNPKGSHELKLKGLKSAVTFSEEPRRKRNSEIQCQPSVTSSASWASSSLCSKFVKLGPEFLSGKIDKHREDSGSNFLKEVASAMKFSESGMPSSSLQLYGENADSLKANNAAFVHNLSMADNSIRTETQSIQRDGAAAVGDMSCAQRQNGDCSVAMGETNRAERQNVRGIVERIESLNRASSQKNYQTCQYVSGLQVPPSQGYVVKKSSMHSMKVLQDTPLRNPLVRPEKKSTPSVPSIPPSAGSMVSSHKRNLPHPTFIRPTLLDYDDHHNRITPKRSYVDSQEELDETTSSSSNGRLPELSDERASSSSNPHSPELSDATASSSSNPRSPIESYETASSSSSPHSSYGWTSQQQTTGSSRGSDEDPEDYYERGDPPPRVKGPSRRYRSPSHKKKATGRLRGLKNKLGLIFHHQHHHHHHHHHDDNDGEKAPTKSMWKNLHKMFQNKDLKHNDKAYQKKAVEKFGKSVVVSNKKQKAGHFRALVKGLMKHSKHSKKSKPSRGGIGRHLGRVQNGDDNKHWWKMFQRHRRGVKLPNRGRVKLGIPRKKKKPRLKTLK